MNLNGLRLTLLLISLVFALSSLLLLTSNLPDCGNLRLATMITLVVYSMNSCLLVLWYLGLSCCLKQGPLILATLFFAVAALLVQYFLFNAGPCLSLSPVLYVWHLIQILTFYVSVAAAIYHTGSVLCIE